MAFVLEQQIDDRLAADGQRNGKHEVRLRLPEFVIDKRLVSRLEGRQVNTSGDISGKELSKKLTGKVDASEGLLEEPVVRILNRRITHGGSLAITFAGIQRRARGKDWPGARRQSRIFKKLSFRCHAGGLPGGGGHLNFGLSRCRVASRVVFLAKFRSIAACRSMPD